MQLRFFLLSLVMLSLSACSRSPFSRSASVEKKYVHTYGVELSPKEWQEYGMHGQVITKTQDGVTVTENYDHNVLQGAKTWSFPDSNSIQRSILYNKGLVTREIHYDISTLPLFETEYVSDTQTVERTFSKAGFPYTIEVFDSGRVFDGQYFDENGKLYTAVIDYHGERTMRNFYGVIIKKDLIADGHVQTSTEYYPEGTPKSVTPYVNGRIHGLKKSYLASSVPLSVEPYHEGKLEGTAIYFNEGVKVREVPYVSGQKQGKEIHLGRKGVLIKEINWRRDQKHGPSIDYAHPDVPKEWYWENGLVTEFTYEQKDAEN